MRNKHLASGRWLLALALLFGCASPAADRRPADTGGAGSGGGVNGTGGSPNTGGASGSGGGTVAPPTWGLPGVDLVDNTSACQAGQVNVGPTPLRRLSRVEYNNMVRDLLGDTTHPAVSFVSETKVAGFNSNTYASSQVNALINRQYLEASEALAATAVSGANNLNNMLSCAPQANDDCAKEFINGFVLRAFRGQLDDTEAAALFQLYQDAKAQFDFATGIQAMITSVLTSPRFLFVLEFGNGNGGPVVALLPYELAARLALYLWRSVPDATLMQAAGANQLSTPDQIEAQATRMLADPRAVDALSDFADQWLDIENMDAVTKDTKFAPVWTPQIAKALHAEALTTFSKLVIAENGNLTDLLTSPSSYVTQDLAAFYKVTSAGADRRTMLNSSDQPRSGILTSGAFLSMHAHPLLPAPVLRGKVVLGNVMCRPVAPPSSIPSLEGKIPPPPSTFVAGQTTRQAFEAHQNKDSICAGCHIAMDNVGFAFDAYDATGMLYPRNAADPTKFDENGVAVDSSGTFNGTSSALDGVSFKDAVEMTQKLAASNLAKACFAVEQFRYALDRAETNADACSLQQAYGDFVANGFNLKKLIVSIVRSDAFRARTAVRAGSACQ